MKPYYLLKSEQPEAQRYQQASRRGEDPMPRRPEQAYACHAGRNPTTRANRLHWAFRCTPARQKPRILGYHVWEVRAGRGSLNR